MPASRDPAADPPDDTASIDTLLGEARSLQASHPVPALRRLERALARCPGDDRRAAEVELLFGALYEEGLGRLDEAIHHYRAAFARDPACLPALSGERRVQRSLGDYARVVALYEIELRLTSPPKAKARLLVQLGRVLAEKLGDPQAGAARLEEALAIAPDARDARALLAELYVRADVPWTEDTDGLRRRAVALLLQSASQQAREGEERGRRACEERAFAIDPDSVEAATALEGTLRRDGDREALRRLYRTTTALPHRFLELGRLAEAAHDRSAAIEAYRAALRVPATAAAARPSLEQLLGEIAAYAELAELRELGAAELDESEHADRLVEVATLYLRAGPACARAALERLEAALASRPTHETALALLGKELLARKEYVRWARALEAAVIESQGDERAQRLIALGHHYEKRLSDFGAALDAWRRAAAITDSPEVQTEVRRLQTRMEGWDNQLQQLDRELARATNQFARADIWRRTAQVYREKSDLENAASLYEAVLEVKPDDPLVLRALVDMWERAGDAARVAEAIKRQLTGPRLRAERLNLLRRLAQIADDPLADLPTAAWACEEILEEEPADREALERLVATCERSGDQEGLLMALDLQTRAVDDEARLALWRRGAVIAEQLGDVAGAIERLERLLAARPDDRSAANALAHGYEVAERWSDLLRIYDRGGVEPDATTWRRVARRASERHEPVIAERAWSEVLSREPNDVESLEALITAHRGGDDPTGFAALLGRRAALASDPEVALALGREQAEVLELGAGDLAAALLILMRLVTEVAPRDVELLASIRARHEDAGQIEAAVRLAERELVLSEELERRVELAEAIAELWSGERGDAERAVEAWRRVQRLAGELPAAARAVDALRGLYLRGGDHAALAVLEEARLTEVDDQEAARILDRLAATREQAGDARAAFDYRLRAWRRAPDAVSMDELRRLAGAAGAEGELGEVYDLRIAAAPDEATRQLLVGQRAAAREASGDLAGAFTDRLQLYALQLGDVAARAEFHRLAAATGRWEEAIAIETDRFQRAPRVEKVLIAREVAQLIEERLGDRTRALHTLLGALILAPDHDEVRQEVWRLARAAAAAPPPRSSPRLSPLLSARDPNDTEPGIDADPDAAAPPQAPWHEVEQAFRALPSRTAAEKVAHLISLARTWDEGANDPEQALRVLVEAARLEQEAGPARAALAELADRCGRPERLIEALDAMAAAAPDADTAVRRGLEAIAARVRSGLASGGLGAEATEDLEDRCQRLLAIAPDCAPAWTQLLALYRDSERLPQLAALLERRSGGPPEGLTGDVERRRALVELARTYEAMSSPREAIAVWQRLVAEQGNREEALRELARLHEAVGAVDGLVEVLGALAQLVPAPEASALQRRRALLLEQPLKQREAALEAWLALDAGGDPAAAEAVERLYGALGRQADLGDLLARRLQGVSGSVRAPLLERRARLLTTLGEHEEAIVVLRELASLRPEEEAVTGALEAALAAAGRHAEQAELLRDRLQRLAAGASTPGERAVLWVRLAALLAGPLADEAAARQAFEAALALAPDDPAVLAELALRRDGGADWSAYAHQRERQADRLAVTPAAAALLVEAARAHLDHLGDPIAAARCLERALSLRPGWSEASLLLRRLLRARGDHAGADVVAARELAELVEGALGDGQRAELETELASSALRRGDRGEAEQRLRAAIAADSTRREPIEALATLFETAGRFREAEALLVSSYRPALEPRAAAALWRRIAVMRERQLLDEEAAVALREADQLLPGQLETLHLLGENRFRLARWAEAAELLTAVALHSDVASLGRAGALACYHGGQAERRRKRMAEASRLYEQALALQPDLVRAITALAELAIDRGDHTTAAQLFERRAEVTADPIERAAWFEALGDLWLDPVHDSLRARDAYRKAKDAAGAQASDGLLTRLLHLAREAGDLAEASAIAEQLVERPGEPVLRAQRLRDAAHLDATLGRTERARERFAGALAVDRYDEEALAGLSGLLVDAGADQSASEILAERLPLLSRPGQERKLARAILWRRLGDARSRLGAQGSAVECWERALELHPLLRDLRYKLVDYYLATGSAEATLLERHMEAILTSHALHVPSLRWLAERAVQGNDATRTRVLTELLAVAGAATPAELARLEQPALPPLPAARPYGGVLDDVDREALATPQARIQGALFAVLWEVALALDLVPDTFAALAPPPLPADPASDLAQVLAAGQRALGEPSLPLFVAREAADPGVALRGRPLALIAGARFADAAASPEMRFAIGRALELARPEHLLIATLGVDEATRLAALADDAFRPAADLPAPRRDEAGQLQRALPGELALRLQILFEQLDDSSVAAIEVAHATWESACRVGLLLGGDLVRVAALLRAEGREEALPRLAQFALSPAFAKLDAKLKPRGGSGR